MRDGVLDVEAMEALLTERPITITMHLTPEDVELALASGGAYLVHPAMTALIVARVLDINEIALDQEVVALPANLAAAC
jgi:hypothetical protein